MSRDLRPYQVQGLADIRATVAQGIKRLVVQLPTAGGKTLLSAAIVNGAQQKKNRVAFVVPRIALVDQTIEEYWKEGITNVGAVQASHQLTDWSKPIQVCSIQTVERKQEFPDAKIIIFDECHEWRDGHRRWMEARPDAIFIALSATPWRKGLGDYFQTLIVVATIRDLMEQGYLSRYRAFGPDDPNLSGVRTVRGDYSESELSERLRNDGQLVADIVDTWKKLHGTDRTLLFAVDRAHAQVLQRRFEESGITCGYQDALTPDSERREIKRKFHTRELPVVVSVGTLILGVDWDCRCISFCRPTKSETLYIQAFGRGLRLAPPGADPKASLTFLDHSGTIGRLGYPESIVHDRLYKESEQEAKEKDEPAEVKEPTPKACPQCAFMMPRRKAVCPNCGHKAQIESGYIERDGELIELTPGAGTPKRGKGKREYTDAEKATFLAELKAYGLAHSRKPGWAAYSYKDKFGTWPDWSIKDIAPAEFAGAAVSMWVKSRNIAYAKGMAKRKAQEAAPDAGSP